MRPSRSAGFLSWLSGITQLQVSISSDELARTR
jgi:hypothetical protein